MATHLDDCPICQQPMLLASFLGAPADRVALIPVAERHRLHIFECGHVTCASCYRELLRVRRYVTNPDELQECPFMCALAPARQLLLAHTRAAAAPAGTRAPDGAWAVRNVTGAPVVAQLCLPQYAMGQSFARRALARICTQLHEVPGLELGSRQQTLLNVYMLGFFLCLLLVWLWERLLPSFSGRGVLIAAAAYRLPWRGWSTHGWGGRLFQFILYDALLSAPYWLGAGALEAVRMVTLTFAPLAQRKHQRYLYMAPQLALAALERGVQAYSRIASLLMPRMLNYGPVWVQTGLRLVIGHALETYLLGYQKPTAGVSALLLPAVWQIKYGLLFNALADVNLYFS